MKSIFFHGEGAKVINVFIVEALSIGGIKFDGFFIEIPSTSAREVERKVLMVGGETCRDVGRGYGGCVWKVVD